MKSKIKYLIFDYLIITISIFIMAIGIYFFKFPNNFAFGGVTGYATIFSSMTNISATNFTNIVNTILLVVGFLILGKSFGFKTIYASIELTIILIIFEHYMPLTKPLTDQAFLEMVIGVFLQSVTTGLLFNVGASSGGTDILAMILKKYTKTNDLGVLFIFVDFIASFMSFFTFGITTGLYSLVGLVAKSFILDSAIETINLCKCFTIICDNPEPICDFIIQKLHRSATIYDARGAFKHNKKTIILTTMKRTQAVRLRNFIKITQPDSFMMITNSSEIIGKGFKD